jgi:hypothetical protein
MMSDLRVDVVDAHDAVVSEGHPVSSNGVQAHRATHFGRFFVLLLLF